MSIQKKYLREEINELKTLKRKGGISSYGLAKLIEFKNIYSKLSELERENKELKGDIESIKLQSKAMQNDLNDSIQNLLAKNDKLMGKEYSMENFIKEKGLKFEYNKAQLLRSYFKIN